MRHIFSIFDQRYQLFLKCEPKKCSREKIKAGLTLEKKHVKENSALEEDCVTGEPPVYVLIDSRN